MARYRYKPSKPVALLTIPFGIGMIVFALTQMDGFHPFLVFWCLAVVAIVGFNLWAAFSERGATSVLVKDPDEGDVPGSDRSG